MITTKIDAPSGSGMTYFNIPSHVFLLSKKDAMTEFVIVTIDKQYQLMAIKAYFAKMQNALTRLFFSIRLPKITFVEVKKLDFNFQESSVVSSLIDGALSIPKEKCVLIIDNYDIMNASISGFPELVKKYSRIPISNLILTSSSGINL